MCPGASEEAGDLRRPCPRGTGAPGCAGSTRAEAEVGVFAGPGSRRQCSPLPAPRPPYRDRTSKRWSLCVPVRLSGRALIDLPPAPVKRYAVAWSLRVLPQKLLCFPILSSASLSFQYLASFSRSSHLTSYTFGMFLNAIIMCPGLVTVDEAELHVAFFIFLVIYLFSHALMSYVNVMAFSSSASLQQNTHFRFL